MISKDFIAVLHGATQLNFNEKESKCPQADAHMQLSNFLAYP